MVVIGPICLLFAWSLFSRKSFRYTVGVTVAILQLYSQVLYIGIELITNFKHITNPTFFVIISIFVRLFLPIPILIYCLRKINSSLEREQDNYKERELDHLSTPTRGRTPSSFPDFATSSPEQDIRRRRLELERYGEFTL